ncbi:hypothetical protein [Chitinophaga deserti]|uniref:hypothetical protein n=1 Tax=Chitinophaga deserti TaxID=2164099 RepID=UPI00130023EB|nr:hypothetical protein [Chitinophaga deserti]
MKKTFVAAPKRFFTAVLLVIGISIQTFAQDRAFAYATEPGNRETRTEKAPEEASYMAKRGCKIDILQEGSRGLRFLVQIDNPLQDKLTLYIKDGNNNTLHKEPLDLTSPRFVGRYNLEKLEDGDYTFEIRNGKNKLEKSVVIKTQYMVNRAVSVE